MKHYKSFFLFPILVLSILNSCSFEKRIYRPGYHKEIVGVKVKKQAKSQQLSLAKRKKVVVKNTVQSADDLAQVSDKTYDNIRKKHYEKSKENKTKTRSKTVSLQKKIKKLTKKSHSNTKFKEKNSYPNGIRKLQKFNTGQIEFEPENSKPKKNKKATTGFILSIAGLILLLFTGWPFLLGSLGVIFSSIGLNQTNHSEEGGKGLAIAGLIIGIIDILLFWLFLYYFISLLIILGILVL